MEPSMESPRPKVTAAGNSGLAPRPPLGVNLLWLALLGQMACFSVGDLLASLGPSCALAPLVPLVQRLGSPCLIALVLGVLIVLRVTIVPSR
jgi:hypothetical protein